MANASPNGPFDENGSPARVPLFDELRVEGIGLVFEQQARAEGFRLIAGVDEVGRGCIAGPVVAAACILDPERELPAGLDDSKKLTAETRERIAAELRETALAFAIGQIEADEIDRINILEATKKAMIYAIEALKPTADFLLIDALKLKWSPLPQRAVIKGDSVSASIAAASIIAKTYRDDLMKVHDRSFPGYGFADHKGYGCASHYTAIRQHGPTPIHRLSFKGVVENKREPGLF